MANDQVQENYIVRLITETKGSLKNLREWRREVDAAKRKMGELRRESGASLEDIKRSFLKAAEASGMFSDDMKRLKSVTNQAMKEMKQETRGLGDVAKIAFGVSIGQVAVNAVRQLARELREGIKSAIEFSGEVARLNINLRAFQRTGGDLSAADLRSFIDDLGSRFRSFSEKDIVSGTQAFLNYARQLDITGEQTKQFLNLAAEQSIVMGQDLPTSVRQLATAITTGRTQSLRPLGIALSGTRIESMALAKGLIEAGDVMTNQVRAAIILAEGMKTAEERARDLEKWNESLQGKQEILNSTWQDTKRILGEGFAPALKVVTNWLIRALDGAKNWINLSRTLSIALQAGLITAVQNVSVAFQNMWRSIRGEDLKDPVDFQEAFRKRFKALEKDLFPLTQLEDAQKRINDGMVDDAEETAEELKDIYGDLAVDIRELLIDEQDDIAEENEDFNQKLEKMRREFNEDKKVERIKLGDDISQINRKYQDKLAELNEDFREEDKKKEEDYFNDLRKLREDFLLDLEDALQERNAKQIVSLIKQFNLRRRQLEREKGIEERQRKRGREDRLADLRRDRDIRIREAKIEFQERMRLMRREFEFRRQQEDIQHQQRIDDIEEETQIRLDELKRRFEDENTITEAGAQLIADTLKAYFGKGGQVDRIYDFLLQKSERTLSNVANEVRKFARKLGKEITEFNEALDVPALPYSRLTGSTQYGGGFAEGGTVIANEPTTVTFGEAGPEKATFEPIGKVGQNENMTFISGESSSGDGGNGKMLVELFLSPDLEARIINKSLSETADVLIKQQRR